MFNKKNKKKKKNERIVMKMIVKIHLFKNKTKESFK